MISAIFAVSTSAAAVCAPAPVRIGLLIAYEYVKRLFLLRDGKDTFLNFVDGSRLCLIYFALIAVGILQGRFVVIIIKY